MFRKIKSWWRPLPVPVALALIPFLPRSSYLNRGYTVWFHLLSLGYFLTRSRFVGKVLVLQGTGICLGWYSAIAFDWFVEGTFCHTLYRNMPGPLLSHMVREGDGDYVMLATGSSAAMKTASHVLDAVGHPGLLCLFWHLHRRRGGTLRGVLTWPVIIFAWHLSRAWSLVHSYHNTGVPAFWYYGHDVYLMKNLNCYLIAYIAEGVCFAAAICCRFYWDRSPSGRTSAATVPMSQSALPSGKDPISGETGDSKPLLSHSFSGTSTSSMVS